MESLFIQSKRTRMTGFLVQGHIYVDYVFYFLPELSFALKNTFKL